MPRLLRVLLIEDSEDDAAILVRELRRGGYDTTVERIETPQAMTAALARETWDIVLADYVMPRFSAPEALALLKHSGLDLPFIIVSGKIGEETAVAGIKAGAHDYIMKDNLARLTIAVERELREAEERLARKRAEQMLRQSEKLAVMGELLAGVAHELNNPLAVVIGQVALLREVAAGSPLAARAEKILKAAERCARIVKNFLALACQRPPRRECVQLNQVVEEAVELLAYPLRVDNVEVYLDLSADLPRLWADPHQLQQVVVNLITNAHHAMREVPPPRRLILTTWADPVCTAVHLEVADTGPGMPSELQARIFEPFFTTKPPGIGTGLGLALCQGIIEGHGGAIRVESQPGHGAVFRVELQVDAAATALEVQINPMAPAHRGKAILVVDDDAEVAEVLAEMLTIDGHQVETAANGAVALQKLQQRAYDLILSDLRMPTLDGPELYREMERCTPLLLRRFIFLTGDMLSLETREFLDKLGRPCLHKPFTLDEVRLVLQQVLQDTEG